MLKYGYVAKRKKTGTVGFALFPVIGAFVAPIFVDEPLGKPLAFFTFLVCAFAAMMASTSADMMGAERPVPDEFYKPLGAFNATVRGVAPHVIEVETDSGAVLFVDARGRKCTAGYGADVAVGDESRSKWGGKARFCAVTGVRAAD